MSATHCLQTSRSGLEAYARTAAQYRNHAGHMEFARLATVFAEFRNGLATILHEMVDTRVQ